MSWAYVSQTPRITASALLEYYNAHFSFVYSVYQDRLRAFSALNLNHQVVHYFDSELRTFPKGPEIETTGIPIMQSSHVDQIWRSLKRDIAPRY